MKGLGIGFTNPVATGGMLGLCLCLGCGGVGGKWVEACTRVWRGGVVLCMCKLSVRIICVYGRSRCLYIVIGVCVWFVSGLVLTSPAFVRSSASHPAHPHGQLVPKTVNRVPLLGARGST